MFNRIIVFSKRILSNKIYIAMLISMVAIALLYLFVPDSSKSTSIRVAIYCEDNSDYYVRLQNELDSINSLYDFYYVESLSRLQADVKASKAECGFYIPDGFFKSYISGDTNLLMDRYIMPSTTMAAPITDTLFSELMKVCSYDILNSQFGTDEYNAILTEKVNTYLNGDQVFTVSDSHKQQYIYENESFHIKLPVNELGMTLVILAAFLGTISFIADNEKGYYIAMSNSELFSIRLINVVTAVLPIYIVSSCCSIISYGFTGSILLLLTVAVTSSVMAIIAGFVFKQRKSMIIFLPLIMLITVVILFIRYILT